jgi:hypothetical protein
VVDNLHLASSSAIRDVQKCDIKSLSLSNITLSSNLWLVTIDLIKMYIISSTIAPSRHRRKYVYFMSLHTSTRMELYFILMRGSLDFGNLIMKS